MTSFTTRAAFLIHGRWHWLRWTHREPNKHAAIIAKAQWLNAEGYDTGNADHEETSRYSFGTR